MIVGNKILRSFRKLVIDIEPCEDGEGYDWEAAVMDVREYSHGTDEGIHALADGTAPTLHEAIVAVLDRSNAWQREGDLAPDPAQGGAP